MAYMRGYVDAVGTFIPNTPAQVIEMPTRRPALAETSPRGTALILRFSPKPESVLSHVGFGVVGGCGEGYGCPPS
jgi:hypothetical protein